MSPEELVSAVAEQYDDERGELTQSALRRLSRYREEAGKTCSTCSEKYPLGAFGLDTSRPDGLAVKCLECAASQRRESRAKARSGV